MCINWFFLKKINFRFEMYASVAGVSSHQKGITNFVNYRTNYVPTGRVLIDKEERFALQYIPGCLHDIFTNM